MKLKNRYNPKQPRTASKTGKPVLDDFWSWIDASLNHESPKSKLSEALLYAKKYKIGLTNYLKNGNCSIFNNVAENSIRPFTIGRKNWLFSGSPKRATASAAIYSLVETAKANGLNPYQYLKLILEDLPGLRFRQYPEFLIDIYPGSQPFNHNVPHANPMYDYHTLGFVFF